MKDSLWKGGAKGQNERVETVSQPVILRSTGNAQCTFLPSVTSAWHYTLQKMRKSIKSSERCKKKKHNMQNQINHLNLIKTWTKNCKIIVIKMLPAFVKNVNKVRNGNVNGGIKNYRKTSRKEILEIKIKQKWIILLMDLSVNWTFQKRINGLNFKSVENHLIVMEEKQLKCRTKHSKAVRQVHSSYTKYLITKIIKP